jgi:Ca2+-binding RTX toxin-like protein
MASSYRRASARALLIGGLVIGITGLGTGPALAATTSTYADGIVEVTTDGAATITCDSEGGLLLVNGFDVNSGNGWAFCETTDLIRVLGDPAVNTINLAGVLAADFGAGATTDIQGGDGADVITGSELPDHIIGGIGADGITGGSADDHISGGIGADVINGGLGNDVIKGGIGADGIDGSTGSDTLMEDADVDFVLTDSSLTGLGADVLTSIERAKLATGTSNNTIDASVFSGDTVLSGGRGDDVLTGGHGSDVLRSSSGADTMTGGDGFDALYAGNGNDMLHGFDGISGNDWVEGDRGVDTCTADLGDPVAGCELDQV